MCCKKYYIILLFLIVCPYQAGIAQFHFRSLKINEGLNLVRAIYRDSNGFLWIGNDGLGLIKTDGLKSQLYLNIPDDLNSINNDGINHLLEDSQKNLWIATRKGLCKYNSTYDNFIRYKLNGLANINIHYLFEDKDGTLWVCSSNGLFQYLEATDNFQQHSISSQNINLNNITSIAQDSEGEFWIGTLFNGIYQFQPKNDTFYHLPNKMLDSIQSHKKILVDKNDNIWIGTYLEGLFQLNKFNKTLKKYPVNEFGFGTSGKYIHNLYQENDSAILIAVDQGGINRLNTKTGKFTYYNSRNSWANGLLSDDIYCFHIDTEGTLWVGTSRSGVYFNNPYQVAFKIYQKKSNAINNNFTSLSHQVVGCLFEQDSAHIWIGTDGGGINILEKKTGKITHLNHKSFDKNSLNSNVVRKISSDLDGNIWVGTWGNNELNKYNRQKGNFKRVLFKIFEEINISEGLWSFEIDKKGRFWFTFTNGYILLLDKNGAKISELSVKNTLNINPESYVFNDLKNNYFVNSFDGLYKFNEQKQQFEKFINVPNLISFCQDNKGNYWAGTHKNGLYLCNEEGKVKNHFLEKDGLPDNSALSILRGENGDIWISTNNGLSQYFASKSLFINYSEKDGLQGNQFFVQSSLRTKSGELYFGGVNGLSCFTPKKTDATNFELPCYFTDLHIFDEKVDFKKENPYLKKHLNESEQLVLDYKVTVFSIGFTSPNFTFPHKVKFAYKLEGFDKNWVYLEPEIRKATYTNLDQGEYNFKVAAINPFTNALSNQKQLKLIILPPWWLTWWFRFSVLFLIIALSLSFYFYRISQLKKYQRKLEKTVKARTIDLNEANQELMAQKEELEATLETLKETQTQLVRSEKMASVGILAGGISHEINNPLNFIQGGNTAIDIYVNDNLDSEHKENLLPLIKIINSGIKRASDIVKSLNRFHRKSVSNNDKCDIHLILDECLVMLKHLMLKITVEKDYTKQNFDLIGNEGDIHQVFLNILTNAVQAIEDSGFISIKTSIQNRMLNIEIKDTGIGIAPDNINKITSPFFTTKEPGKGVGLGMSIAYSIIKNHQGDIKYKSEVNKGTTVIVNFPVKLKE